jgi:glycosyltransferase involved in cell wall biosynthesis
MEILILNWKDVKNPHVGGAEVIAFEFAKRLVKEGHNLTFFSRTFPNCLKEEMIDGVRIVRRGNRLSVYLKAFLYYRNLKKKPDRVIDMVNTICWQTPLYVPKGNRYAYVNQLAEEVFFFELSKPISYLAYLLEKIQYLTYKDTRFLCYSNSTSTDLQRLGINKRKISLFPMGLDHERYKTGGAKTKYPLFVYVGRLVRMKRVDLCIRAFKNVLKKDKHAKLAIIGNGPDEERLYSLVKKLQLSKSVAFVNKNNFFLKQNKLDVKIKMMQKSWGLLLPSVKEGWGMVVTEAAASGTPSIVSDVTGLRDSVVKNKTGLILSKNPSKEELAGAMIKMIENSDLRNKMAKEAISWAKKFSWDKSYKEFKKIIV